jgi:signal recognition particle GTPase
LFYLLQDAENRSICLSKENCSTAFADARARILSSELNDSQKAAVVSCLVNRESSKQSTVKLIWGPPGTGKTKTVGMLLFSLLKMNCRTLTCAPTNTAVLEVTQRLLKNVAESVEYDDSCALGDIILWGNGQKMNISNHHGLLDVFLDNRVDALRNCLASPSGWVNTLQSMICFLNDPQGQYSLYLKNRDDDGINRNQGKEMIDDQSSIEKKSKKMLKKVIVKALNENKSKKKRKEKIPKHEEKESGDGSSQEEEKKCDNPLTLEEFVQRRFNSIEVSLKDYLVNLSTHLPTSCISLEVVKKMRKALDLLKSFGTLLHTVSAVDKGLEQVLSKKLGRSRHGHLEKLSIVRKECVCILRSLPKKFPRLPKSSNRFAIKKFCLEKACLIFCTVSNSAKLHTEKMTPLEMLVIDEAAQLKECESTIPLQLPGLRHAILIGDERQLPAMVKSKV